MTSGEQSERGSEYTSNCGGKEGRDGDTVSRTLTWRLPHPLLFVKWEITGRRLNGLRELGEGERRRYTLENYDDEPRTRRGILRNISACKATLGGYSSLGRSLISRHLLI